MSPTPAYGSRFDSSFPRVSGDEPGVLAGNLGDSAFSPRERG